MTTTQQQFVELLRMEDVETTRRLADLVREGRSLLSEASIHLGAIDRRTSPRDPDSELGFALHYAKACLERMMLAVDIAANDGETTQNNYELGRAPAEEV